MPFKVIQGHRFRYQSKAVYVFLLVNRPDTQLQLQPISQTRTISKLLRPNCQIVITSGIIYHNVV